MLFFSHLLLGILAGIILALIFKDRRVILFTAVGGVLPDLIDKPLGYIIFRDSIGSGRIFFHGFWIMFLILFAGIIIYIKIRNPLLFSLGAGVLVHQLADSMWESPVNWFWPVFGPYSGRLYYDDFFYDMFLKEISSFEEVLSLFLVFILLLAIFLSGKKNRF